MNPYPQNLEGELNGRVAVVHKAKIESDIVQARGYSLAKHSKFVHGSHTEMVLRITNSALEGRGSFQAQRQPDH